VEGKRRRVAPEGGGEGEDEREAVVEAGGAVENPRARKRTARPTEAGSDGSSGGEGGTRGRKKMTKQGRQVEAVNANGGQASHPDAKGSAQKLQPPEGGASPQEAGGDGDVGGKGGTGGREEKPGQERYVEAMVTAGEGASHQGTEDAATIGKPQEHDAAAQSGGEGGGEGGGGGRGGGGAPHVTRRAAGGVAAGAMQLHGSGSAEGLPSEHCSDATPSGKVGVDLAQSGNTAVKSRPKRARQAEGFYSVSKRRTKPKVKRTTRAIVRMERAGAAGGPLKYLIRVGPQLVARVEADASRRRMMQGRVYDDMG
jgi:hypothetical protein